MAAAPGMTFSEVLEGSTVALDTPPDREGGWWMAQPEGKSKLKLVHPTLGFELEPSLFSLLEAKERTVRRMRSTPQLGYKNLGEACRLIDALHETFVAAGWEARLRYGPERIEWMSKKQSRLVAAIYKPLPDIREKVDPSVNWSIEIELRKAIQAGSPEAAHLGLDADAFLVTAVLQDEVHPP